MEFVRSSILLDSSSGIVRIEGRRRENMKSPPEKFVKEEKSVVFPAALGHSVSDYRTFNATCTAWLPGCLMAPTPPRRPHDGQY
jgi:hypothetical protein